MLTGFGFLIPDILCSYSNTQLLINGVFLKKVR
jgi:hypothetical protein